MTRAAGPQNLDATVAEQFPAGHTTPAAGAAGGNDAAAQASGVDSIGRGESGACEWYGDSAYGTGDFRYALGKAGHAAVIKPKPLTAPVEDGFTVDDFTVDERGLKTRGYAETVESLQNVLAATRAGRQRLGLSA